MCNVAMRPMIPVNETEVRCDEEDGHPGAHRGKILDYAYPGSETTMVWMAGDRRSFVGEWPGRCGESFSGDQCILPQGHRGNHAT